MSKYTAIAVLVISTIFLSYVSPAYANETLPPVNKKVLVLEFNPILESHGNVRLSAYMNWSNPQTLDNAYIQDLHDSSSGYANFSIVERIIIDDIPQKQDGFNYTDQSYLDCINDPSNCHQPDITNYLKILNDFDVCGKRNRGEIDEVWLWGGPYFGYYESRMTGPGAFYLNSTALSGSSCNKKLVIMGFNYERGEAETIHSFGHRVESTMTHVFGGWQQNQTDNDWEKFGLVDIQSPDYTYSGCGSIHYPPNGRFDYDYTNPQNNSTMCNDFLDYPDLNGQLESFGCSIWNCTQRGYLKWWFSHVPRVDGTKSGKLNNWWHYVLDYDEAKTWETCAQYSASNCSSSSSGMCSWLQCASNNTGACLPVSVPVSRVCTSQPTIINGSFESTNPFPWKFGRINRSISNTDVRTGNYSLKVNQPCSSCPTEIGEVFGFEQIVGGLITQGQTYTYSIWAKPTTSVPYSGRIVIWESGGSQPPQPHVVIFTLNQLNSWTRLAVSGTIIRPDRTHLILDIYLDTPNNSTVAFDDAQLILGTLASPVPTPSPTPSPSPLPTPYTTQDLITLLRNYLSTNDSMYLPLDGKVNMLDAQYILSRLQ